MADSLLPVTNQMQTLNSQAPDSASSITELLKQFLLVEWHFVHNQSLMHEDHFSFKNWNVLY